MRDGSEDDGRAVNMDDRGDTMRIIAALFALVVVVLLPVHAQAQASKPAAPCRGRLTASPISRLLGLSCILTRAPGQPGQQSISNGRGGQGSEQQNAERRARRFERAKNRRTGAGGGGQAVGAYNDFWIDGGATVVGDRRTRDHRPPTPRAGPLWLRQAGS
jgi:hypothetical protein